VTSTDTAGHPDVAEISDLTEGLLPPSRTADIRQHLDACELCADVHASLEEIRGLLGTLPGPTHMPADVAGRIDAALAAEALLNATAPDSTEAPTVATASRPTPSGSLAEPSDGEIHRASDADEPARVSRETAASADRPAGHARATTTGPGRKDRKRAGRRRIAVLGAVFTAAALGLGSVLLSTLDDGKQSDDTAQGRQTASADTFSEGKLENQVATLLAKNEREGGGPRTPNSFGAESVPGSNEPKVLKEPVVPACVREGIGRNDTALAAEEGTFQGTEAVLVVLPDPSDAARVTAYIVDATCVDQPSASAKAKVLLKETYPRS
jgi:anti-sigma factor RsiW